MLMIQMRIHKYDLISIVDYLDMVIKLYIDYASQPSRSVYALCIAANIPYEVIQTSMIAGQVKSKQFAKINPMRQVPAIHDTDNNLTLVESHTILRYLCLKFNLPEQWYPLKDLARQAKLNEFLDFHHSNTRKCSYLSFHILFAPLLKFGDPTFNQKHTYKVVNSALRNFEKIYLKEQLFLGGENPNIGDLIAFHDITMLEVLDFDYTPYVHIQKWVARMKEFPYIKKANEQFWASKENLKSLRQAPKAKL